MNKQEYELSKLKKILFAKRRQGVKEVTWRINSKEKLEYIERFFDVEPWLHEIRTRTFQNIRTIESTLLKDIHYDSKKGKKTIVRKLKKSDKRYLDDYGIRYRAVTFKIKLIK